MVNKLPFSGDSCFKLTANWKALISLNVSSTDRPTGKSLMVICLKMPVGSIMNNPLKAIPSSSINTP